jgi:hypothetical protein
MVDHQARDEEGPRVEREVRHPILFMLRLDLVLFFGGGLGGGGLGFSCLWGEDGGIEVE